MCIIVFISAIMKDHFWRQGKYQQNHKMNDFFPWVVTIEPSIFVMFSRSVKITFPFVQEVLNGSMADTSPGDIKGHEQFTQHYLHLQSTILTIVNTRFLLQ